MNSSSSAKAPEARRRAAGRHFSLAALCLAWLAPSADAFVGEPETLIYGRILNRRNPNVEHLVTSGELRWTIRKPDGSTLQLAGEVDTFDGGNHSYLLRIPHQAVMLGQQPAPQTVPLGTGTAKAFHAGILFNGSPAAILPPATSGFDLDQLLRAGALRIDLEIDVSAEDTDGDGLPDWWEDLHGLDKQNAADALADLNGNGLNNRAEYLAGNDPNHDPVKPLLLTREIVAYADSTSLAPLEAADSDSSPAQLVFTLHTLPLGGRLALRNAAVLPAETARTLEQGATFTQADVQAGRLVFVHEPGETTGFFEVGVRDENPAHEESRGEVLVRLFESDPGTPALTAAESLRFEAHRLARDHGHLVADFAVAAGMHRLAAPSAGLSPAAYQTHAANYGEELPHILLGGPAGDILTGGSADDFLHGGGGADILTGGRGADTFLFTGPSSTVDILADFNPAEGDIIDLAGVLNGTSKLLTDYVRIRRSGADALLEVCAAGTKQGFTDLVIRLQGSTLQPGDLAGLHYAGSLQTGAVGLPPRLGIVATVPQASENGPTDGIFTITREGSTAESLLIHLAVTGNATNGVDYQSIPNTVLLPEGQTGVTIVIRPYVDAAVEFNEIVHLALTASPDYLIADGAASAQIAIEDLKPQIRLEVLDGLAGAADGSPGSILMRRGGLLSPEVFVQFTLSGTAVNGTDYNHVTPYVTLSPGQTTRLIEFVPKPSASFGAAEAKTIRMTVKADASYALPAPAASLLLVPKKLNYPAWLAEHGLSSAGETPGEMPLLMRYAFSVDPQRPGDPATLARMPKAVPQDGYLTLRFRRKPGIADMQYRVEYSNDLRQWTGGPEVVEDISAQAAPNDPGAAVFRARRPMSEADKAAMRVRLVLPESSTD